MKLIFKIAPLKWQSRNLGKQLHKAKCHLQQGNLASHGASPGEAGSRTTYKGNLSVLHPRIAKASFRASQKEFA